MIAVGILGLWGLLGLLSLPKAIHLLRNFMEKMPEAADAVTAQLNTVFGLLLILALVLDKMVPL
jgi:1,4-dihydroxy-2-naphthoate octaprenyltransferase